MKKDYKVIQYYGLSKERNDISSTSYEGIDNAIKSGFGKGIIIDTSKNVYQTFGLNNDPISKEEKEEIENLLNSNGNVLDFDKLHKEEIIGSLTNIDKISEIIKNNKHKYEIGEVNTDSETYSKLYKISEKMYIKDNNHISDDDKEFIKSLGYENFDEIFKIGNFHRSFDKGYKEREFKLETSIKIIEFIEKEIDRIIKLSANDHNIIKLLKLLSFAEEIRLISSILIKTNKNYYEKIKITNNGSDEYINPPKNEELNNNMLKLNNGIMYMNNEIQMIRNKLSQNEKEYIKNNYYNDALKGILDKDN